jgi:hypothetical protein
VISVRELGLASLLAFSVVSVALCLVVLVVLLLELVVLLVLLQPRLGFSAVVQLAFAKLLPQCQLAQRQLLLQRQSRAQSLPSATLPVRDLIKAS